MSGSIKIDFADLERGTGLEPVIMVTIDGSSDDPRDRLLKTLFQGLTGNELSFKFLEQTPIHAKAGESDLLTKIMIFRP